MAALDTGARHAVHEFARAMDIDLSRTEADDGGAYTLEFAQSGRFSIMGAEDPGRVLVSLTRRILLEDLIGFGRLLQLGGHDANREMVIQPGLTSAGLPVLAVSLPSSGLDRSRLETVFETLRMAFQRVGM